jgi:hypothetical protein
VMKKYRSESKGGRNFDTALHYNTVDMTVTEKAGTAESAVRTTRSRLAGAAPLCKGHGWAGQAKGQGPALQQIAARPLGGVDDRGAPSGLSNSSMGLVSTVHTCSGLFVCDPTAAYHAFRSPEVLWILALFHDLIALGTTAILPTKTRARIVVGHRLAFLRRQADNVNGSALRLTPAC